jgi:alpha-tubulin suppressor-like RCC1 family protein
VIQISAGRNHTCARKDDGTVWCWGANESGQVGDPMTAPSRHAVAQVMGLDGMNLDVFAGAATTCVRRTDGAAWCWGANQFGQLGDGTVMSRSMPAPITGCR